MKKKIQNTKKIKITNSNSIFWFKFYCRLNKIKPITPITHLKKTKTLYDDTRITIVDDGEREEW